MPEIDWTDEEEQECVACPTCGGPCYELGALGRKMWYRCRNCGAEHCVEAMS